MISEQPNGFGLTYELWEVCVIEGVLDTELELWEVCVVEGVLDAEFELTTSPGWHAGA